VRRSGTELGKALDVAIKAIRDTLDDLSRVRRLGGHAPSAELAETGIKDLLRTTLTQLPWVGMPMPNRRWHATELANSWASAIDGGAVKLEQQVKPCRR
jgi:hypothetical protein